MDRYATSFCQLVSLITTGVFHCPNLELQVQSATVGLGEGTVGPSMRLVQAFLVRGGTLATLTNTSCTWRDSTSWKEGTTIAVTLVTEGWHRGALRLTEKCVGSIATSQYVVCRLFL